MMNWKKIARKTTLEKRGLVRTTHKYLSTTTTMCTIYILECERGKYYVGKTDHPIKRVDDHFTNKGAYWTKRYKPIQVLHKYTGCDKYDEDKYTIMMMDEYGIDNVRGGSFSSLVLTKSEIKVICKMLRSVQDICFNCGSPDHFITKCTRGFIDDDLKIIQNSILNLCHRIDRSFSSRIDVEQYVGVLKVADPVVFDGMTVARIKRISNNDSVNYYKLTDKLIGILNRV